MKYAEHIWTQQVKLIWLELELEPYYHGKNSRIWRCSNLISATSFFKVEAHMVVYNPSRDASIYSQDHRRAWSNVFNPYEVRPISSIYPRPSTNVVVICKKQPPVCSGKTSKLEEVVVVAKPAKKGQTKGSSCSYEAVQNSKQLIKKAQNEWSTSTPSKWV